MDELPQLWNVLRGDMSLVGPRPALREEVKSYDATDWCRLDTQQGLTCLWQVGGRATLPFKRQVQLDIKYMQERSISADIALLLRTLPAVVSGQGAC